MHSIRISKKAGAPIVCLLLLLAACGGALGDDTAGQASDGGEDATAKQSTDGASVVEDGGSDGQLIDETAEVGVDMLEPSPKVPDDAFIGVAFPHFRDPYWIAEAWGVQSRADELGVRIEIGNAGGYGMTAEQVRQIEDYITQGADALIVGAVDAVGVAPAINSAWQQGIPVIYANALAESDTQAGVYTNDCAVGELQAGYMAEQNPQARVVVFTGPPGVSWPAARSDCFKEELAKLAPEAEILTEKFHDMDRAVVLETMQDVLEAFPEIDYVYNNTDLQAKGVVDALRAAGYEPGEVGVTTLTLGREAFDLMQDGWIEMALAERPVLQGELAVDMALRILGGEEIPSRWAVEHPMFTSEDLEAYEATESQWNWEPEDYQP